MIRLKSLAPWCFAVALMLPLAVGVTPAAAQDADGDRLPDLVDVCPGTPLLELVDSTGCSVCPCGATWASHSAYYTCVYNEANARYAAGLLTRTQKTNVLTHAKNSTCGDPTLTRCCIWRKLVYGSLGSCSLTAPASCSYAVIGKWADNRGTGSCYYNPCTW